MIIAATGHRPNKLGGYSPQARQRLVDIARGYLSAQKDLAGVISGMALGWDQAFAVAAQDLGIWVHAAVPFRGQESPWPKESQREWGRILSRCASVTVVCGGGYAAQKMQERNEWMVRRCHRVAALWDGSAGGTANCIRYAQQLGRPIDNLWK